MGWFDLYAIFHSGSQDGKHSVPSSVFCSQQHSWTGQKEKGSDWPQITLFSHGWEWPETWSFLISVQDLLQLTKLVVALLLFLCCPFVKFHWWYVGGSSMGFKDRKAWKGRMNGAGVNQRKLSFISIFSYLLCLTYLISYFLFLSRAMHNAAYPARELYARQLYRFISISITNSLSLSSSLLSPFSPHPHQCTYCMHI